MTMEINPVNDKDSIEVEGMTCWIGDPCYISALSKEWDAFCSAYFAGETSKREADANAGSIVLSINGMEMVVGGTAYGDGSYEVDGAFGSLGVDAGILGVIPEYLFETLGINLDDEQDGLFVEDIHGSCEIDEEGTLWVGSGIKVVTKERCENCGSPEGECDCERCYDCGEWEDCCTCEDTCHGCGMQESECCCDEEEEEEEY